MVRISSLLYYPVKGCAAVSVSEMELVAAGPSHDRSFMVVTTDGTYRTQRYVPRLAVIRPEVGAGGERLTLRAPEVEALDVDVELDRERCDVDLFGAPFRAVDQGEDAAAWLSQVLGSPARLVRVPAEHDRATTGRTPGTAAFADGNALHITSLTSWEALNERIIANGGEPVPMERFRPNLVLDGWAQPHTEDRMRSMTVGDARLGYAKLAIRCAVATVDQRAGLKSGPEPLRTLAGYRRATGGGVAFGTKASVVRAGKISVGDEMIVDSWGESEL